jgi:poly-beta-1,6-N-acetyl-D-glucosamine synthase
MSESISNYVIITPAHNEEAHLERTIQSMLAQTRRPRQWIIVNDSSTDRTREIAEKFAAENDFIRVLSIARNGNRAFSNKARAFNAGLKTVQSLPYDAIGNLDADISVEPQYFENLLRGFEKDSRLGVTGGIIYTKIGDEFITCDQTLDSVAGAVQLFRRECFEEVGGEYLPLPYGGIDAAAEIIAKMKGWTVRKTLENKALEHRQTGTATATPLVACYRLGRRFHSLGYSMLFYIVRCFYRLGNKPVVLGSCAAFLGFVAAALTRDPVCLPSDVVQHLRSAQRKKLRQLLLFRTTAKS